MSPPCYSTLNKTTWRTIRTTPHPPDPRIIILTLHRPQQHNAFTDEMRAELETAYGMFDVDERVKCVVVTGEGRMFCAGADLEVGFGEGSNRGRGKEGEGEGEGEMVGGHRDGGGRAVLATHHCRKPTIAAINGHAVGIGITMTLPMTIRVAHRDAKIGFVFARRGLVMEAASSFYLPRLIGYSRALQVVTTGATYKAGDRVYDGLFAELCDTQDEVLPKALEIAMDVVRNTSVVSTYLMREMMYRGTASPEEQHLLDSRIIYDLFGSPDNTEGVKSFMEKRPAKFTGTMEHSRVSAYPWWMQVDTRARAKANPTGGPKL